MVDYKTFLLLLSGAIIHVFVARYIIQDLRAKLKQKHIELLEERVAREKEQQEWKELNDSRNLVVDALTASRFKLAYSVQRLSIMVRNLRKRQISIVRSITWFKTPETDIRVLKVQVREQLAIDLENKGVIEYIISEYYREDIQETEVTVKAKINILNMK